MSTKARASFTHSYLVTATVYFTGLHIWGGLWTWRLKENTTELQCAWYAVVLYQHSHVMLVCELNLCLFFPHPGWRVSYWNEEVSVWTTHDFHVMVTWWSCDHQMTCMYIVKLAISINMLFSVTILFVTLSCDSYVIIVWWSCDVLQVIGHSGGHCSIQALQQAEGVREP